MDETPKEEMMLVQQIEVGPVKVDTGSNSLDFAFVTFFIFLLFFLSLFSWYIKSKK